MSRKVNLGKIVPEKGVDYFDGADGTDGFSPIANVTQIDDGTIISITDEKGTSTATVRNGKDGADGQDGITPHIGENGNWWIGDTDTGAKVEGTGGGDSTPVGNIISFMGTIAPDGYLTCDGAVLNIADYSRLASHFETQFGSKNYFGGDGTTTFAVPDLRNEFLRGYHGEADEQLSGEIGVHQDATKHINTYGNAYGKGLAFGNASDDLTQAQNTDTTETFTHGYAQITGTKYTDVNPSAYYTSRPTNVAVLYCIKY